MSGFLWRIEPGVWRLRIEAPRDAISGKRRMVHRTVRGTKQDAQRVLNELAVEVDKGRHGGASITLGQLLHQWLELVESDRSPTTLRGYRQTINRNILPTFGDIAVKDIQTADLDNFYRGLVRRKHLSPTTVRQIHAIIRRAFRQAEMWGWVSANPAINATPPRLVKPDVSPPDVQEVRQLIQAALEQDPAFGHFVHLAATTGARRGELCALRWYNVDLDAGEVTIEKAIVEVVGGGVVEKDTKTHQVRRMALDPATVDILRAQQALSIEFAEFADTEITDESFIFSLEPDGSAPWLPGYVSSHFRKLRTSVGLEGVRLHDLRHFAATRLMAAGAPVRTVSGRLGHANPSTTLSVYSHFVQSSDREYADVLGAMVSGVDDQGLAVAKKGVSQKKPAPKSSTVKKRTMRP